VGFWLHITGFLAEVSRNIQGFGYLLCLFSHSLEYTYDRFKRTRMKQEEKQPYKKLVVEKPILANPVDPIKP
jgi:hypothetical protein